MEDIEIVYYGHPRGIGRKIELNEIKELLRGYKVTYAVPSLVPFIEQLKKYGKITGVRVWENAYTCGEYLIFGTYLRSLEGKWTLREYLERLLKFIRMLGSKEHEFAREGRKLISPLEEVIRTLERTEGPTEEFLQPSMKQGYKEIVPPVDVGGFLEALIKYIEGNNGRLFKEEEHNGVKYYPVVVTGIGIRRDGDRVNVEIYCNIKWDGWLISPTTLLFVCEKKNTMRDGEV